MRSVTLLAVVFLAALSSVYSLNFQCKNDPTLKKQSDINHQKARCDFNVYYFSGTDYPAIFSIFAGLVIILSVAVLFIVAGMMSMNPGKDSIIYRMTTTRMKKD
ncbi:hypothetical protein QR680_010441 [Steinernema hermaphroditum]|uniref:Renin receptor-like C-terminal transmembrane spanning segment domain-containing protein n=1 Tax=Steinernema hermaphroditum TaxID=289476 RepID=A0AA39IP05_9BILA|nr:hypothetical protein QR680_010441 [Steinernema hermaphroditum]